MNLQTQNEIRFHLTSKLRSKTLKTFVYFSLVKINFLDVKSCLRHVKNYCLYQLKKFKPLLFNIPLLLTYFCVANPYAIF